LCWIENKRTAKLQCSLSSHLLLFSYFFASIKVQCFPTDLVLHQTELEKMVERSIQFFVAQVEEGTCHQIQLYILFSVCLTCHFWGYHGFASSNNLKGVVISMLTLTLIWLKKKGYCYEKGSVDNGLFWQPWQ
jgi:hypothetical protein